MAETLPTFAQLLDLDRDWFRAFGEHLSLEQVGPADIPLLKQCLEEKSQKPLDDDLESRGPNGKVVY